MKKQTAIWAAIGAALLYALSTPFSKMLLTSLSPTFLAALVYLGAGFGMLIVAVIRSKTTPTLRVAFHSKDYFAVIMMIILDILAPIALLIGLQTTQPENVSLLNNFEIVATTLIALLFFGEVIPKRVRLAILFVVVASSVLSLESEAALTFSSGSLLVVFAATCWGLENNFTRLLSLKDPLKVVIIKGIFAGLGSLIIAGVRSEITWQLWPIIAALIIGVFSYGFSIWLYVIAQRDLGAAKTSAYYALAPFIGGALSLILFNHLPSLYFIIGLILMAIGTYFASTNAPSTDKPRKELL